MEKSIECSRIAGKLLRQTSKIHYTYSIITNSCHCSKNAWYEVGEYYANDSSDPDDFHYYWLNNFDDLWKSYGMYLLNNGSILMLLLIYSHIVRTDGG